MFSLARWESYVEETNFASRKQKMYLSQVKNVFASHKQILLPKHMFPSLATMEPMLSTAKFCPRVLLRLFFIKRICCTMCPKQRFLV